MIKNTNGENRRGKLARKQKIGNLLVSRENIRNRREIRIESREDPEA
jgi:hypothetical protein